MESACRLIRFFFFPYQLSPLADSLAEPYQLLAIAFDGRYRGESANCRVVALQLLAQSGRWHLI
jgi:hypothetical protein